MLTLRLLPRTTRSRAGPGREQLRLGSNAGRQLPQTAMADADGDLPHRYVAALFLFVQFVPGLILTFCFTRRMNGAKRAEASVGSERLWARVSGDGRRKSGRGWRRTGEDDVK